MLRSQHTEECDSSHPFWSDMSWLKKHECTLSPALMNKSCYKNSIRTDFLQGSLSWKRIKFLGQCTNVEPIKKWRFISLALFQPHPTTIYNIIWKMYCEAGGISLLCPLPPCPYETWSFSLLSDFCLRGSFYVFTSIWWVIWGISAPPHLCKRKIFSAHLHLCKGLLYTSIFVAVGASSGQPFLGPSELYSKSLLPAPLPRCSGTQALEPGVGVVPLWIERLPVETAVKPLSSPPSHLSFTEIIRRCF